MTAGARGRVYRNPNLDIGTVGYPLVTLHGGWSGEVYVGGSLAGRWIEPTQAAALAKVCEEIQRASVSMHEDGCWVGSIAHERGWCSGRAS